MIITATLKSINATLSFLLLNCNLALLYCLLTFVLYSGHRRGPSLVVIDAPIESKCDLTTSMGQPPSVTVDRIVSMRAKYSSSSGHDSFLIRIAHCDTFRQLTSVQIRTWVAYLRCSILDKLTREALLSFENPVFLG